jgi:D-tyrosyl-tRNA(Tyr) deacylase
MRAVIQRVQEATVRVDGQVVGAIEQGLLVFLAVAADDDAEDLQWLVKKVQGQRVFADDQGRMNLDTAAIAGSFLVVSQFTLLATTVKGNRPGFPHGAEPAMANAYYENFCDVLQKKSGCPVARGQFAADMKVSLLNDGPVTIIIDSKLRE